MQFENELVDGTFAPVAARFCGKVRLSFVEKTELLCIVQGFAIKDSAEDSRVAPETIRTRRKHIYRKLNVAGATELVADLLAYTLGLLAHGARVQDGRFSLPSAERNEMIGQPYGKPGTAA